MNDIYLSVLQKYWGYDQFRGIQREIIESIGEGRDTLGLMPTGGGKSITFQVPALCKEGICVVITPLIALMKDQVQNLKKRGIKAAAIYSGLSRNEIIVTLENCIFGNYKFLYVSPERLTTELFKSKLRHMTVSFLTVDEAHCISQWGYDFRPSYLRIAEIRTLLPGIPVLALTATATPEVVKDIQLQLGFEKENVFRMSFERKNLAYVVRKTEDKSGELLHILNNVKGSAIVYTRNRKGTKETAAFLSQNGFSATFYHAGLNDAEKDIRQRSWQQDEIRVMVATNAFGMGIDKPDVRIVIHMDLPDSIEAYFQEAGRAGRDGKTAYAVLLYQKSDRTKMMKRIPDTYPEKEDIRTVYEHACYYCQLAMGDGMNVTREFNLEEFCHNFKHFPTQAYSALKILSQAGYIDYTDEQENNSRLHFLLNRDELYRIHECQESQELLMQWILRTYGGVFSDYVFIDESRLATLCNLTPEEVYHDLIELNRRRILHYIPHKRSSYITFCCKRIEKDRIVIPKEIYEIRKENYKRQIESIINYATEEDFCRSRVLLHYFGEENEHNCMKCDVCLSEENKGEKEKIRRLISQLLADGQSHSTDELSQLQYPSSQIKTVLRQMIAEEEVIIKDGYLKSMIPDNHSI